MTDSSAAYDRLAERYDALFVDEGRRVWTDAYSQHVTTGTRVLDLGCGTGSDSLLLARQGCEVVGVDSSTGMLRLARQRAAEARLNVEFMQADITGVYPELGGRTFDLVVSGFAAINTVRSLADLASTLDSITTAQGRVLLHFLTPGGVYDRLGHLARLNFAGAFAPLHERRRTVLVGDAQVEHHEFDPHWLLQTFLQDRFDLVACLPVGALTPDDGPTRVPPVAVRALRGAEHLLRRTRHGGSLGRFAILSLKKR